MAASHDSTKHPTPLAEIKRHRRPLRNVHHEVRAKLSLMNRIALFITQRVGTMGFFLVIFGWTILWLGWNLFGPERLRFDPAMGFVLYLFVCNVIQILLMPLIMVGQNLQGMHSEARAQHDLEVNVKAEQEIEVIHQHLEYQNDILMRMVDKLGVDLQSHIAQSHS